MNLMIMYVKRFTVDIIVIRYELLVVTLNFYLEFDLLQSLEASFIKAALKLVEVSNY